MLRLLQKSMALSNQATVKILGGICLVGAGATAVSYAVINILEVEAPDLPFAPLDKDKLKTYGTRITDQGYTSARPVFNFSTSDINWDEAKMNTYPTTTMAQKLRKEKQVNLVSEDASADVWTNMSLSVLDAHADQEDSYLAKYSPSFRSIVFDIKKNWQDKETRKAAWGDALRKLCGASYRMAFNENTERSKEVAESISSLCSKPSDATVS